MTKEIISKEEDFISILEWLHKNHSARKSEYYLDGKPESRGKIMHWLKEEVTSYYKSGSIELKVSDFSNLSFEINGLFKNKHMQDLKIKCIYVVPIEKSKKEISSYI